MKKYKSLLYREWKLSSKHYISRMCLLLMATILMALVVGFMDATGGGFAVFISYLLVALAAGLTSEDNGVFKSDINSDWMTYSYALPITALDKAITRYILKLITVVLGMAFGILCAMGICAMVEVALSSNMIMHFFLILDVCLAYDLVTDALVLRARDTEELKKWSIISYSVMFGAIFVLPEFIPSDELDPILNAMDENASPEQVGSLLKPLIESIDKIGVVAIPLMIVLLVVGFVFAWKNFERRGA
ncbi:MAG: ABC-2 transporter permease [Lachnospiraceae bacterium]|nr:ABC-2 transporter permease [Lachnospiraceae bacterium]